MFLYDGPILDYSGSSRIACPTGGSSIKEANVDMTIILKLQEFGRGVVGDEDEIDLGVWIR
jgi:hypothetical protein